MPNTPGIIKTESAPMFFRMHCADLKWIFYSYRLNRRCVLLGQPYHAVAKQPEPHMHGAHVLCDAQVERLHQGVKTPAQLLALSSAPKSCLGCRGHALHFTKCLLAMPLTTQSPKNSQGISWCTDLPPP